MGMDIIGTRPTNERTGSAFQSSVWSWKPLHGLMMEANERFALGLDIPSFDEHSGHGIAGQAACDRLASALETLIAENPLDEFSIYFDPQGPEAEVIEQFTSCDWVLAPAKPSHYVASNQHVREFVEFLRTCGGGFTIWKATPFRDW